MTDLNPSGSSKPSQREANWAMAAHFSGLTTFIVPFGNLLAPLIIWMIHKDDMSFVRDQAKEVLNFQLSFVFYVFLSSLSTIILIGYILLPAVFIAWVVLMIKAGIDAGEGTAVRYPYIIRIIN